MPNGYHPLPPDEDNDRPLVIEECRNMHAQIKTIVNGMDLSGLESLDPFQLSEFHQGLRNVLRELEF